MQRISLHDIFSKISAQQALYELSVRFLIFLRKEDTLMIANTDRTVVLLFWSKTV